VRASLGETPRELLRIFEQAALGGVGLGFQYRNRDGTLATRQVEPHGLAVQTPVWYILALDLEKREPRMFRMDRIAAPRALPSVRFTPDDRVARALLEPSVRWQPLIGR
jgi:predicted DNA-binding transcriptional regulator YafY